MFYVIYVTYTPNLLALPYGGFLSENFLCTLIKKTVLISTSVTCFYLSQYDGVSVTTKFMIINKFFIFFYFFYLFINYYLFFK